MPTMVRRKSKARRALIASAAVAAVAATTAVSVQLASADETDPGPEAEQTCDLEILPIPEGLESTLATGMSTDGSVVAYYAEPLGESDPDAGYEQRPFIYADGEAVEVPMPGDYQRIADVNSTGDGAGHAEVDGDVLPYVWRDGELSQLPGGRGFAHGINEDGDIVGVLWDPPGSGTGGSNPTLWPADGSGPVTLPLPADAMWGTATAVSDEGTVVGHITLEGDNSGDTKPYVWHADGTGAELPLPEGVDRDEAYARPMDVSGDWASGFVTAPGVEAPGVRWNLAEGTVEQTVLGWYEETVAVNAEGTVAGHIYDSPTAAYQNGDTVVELPGVLDPADNINYDNAEAISADGTLLAGTAWAGQNNWNAVLWTCG